jgi:hypothetical protein
MVAPKMAEEPRTRIEHPNRGKASSQVTRLIVVLLLLVSVGLMLVVTIGGWATLAGAKPVQLAYILLYLILAFFVLRWSRGVLPLIAALAIGLGIFAAISVPGWYARDHPGFTDPGLPSDLLGLVCALIAIVQLLLIFFAMSGFRQAWNVEVEKPAGGERDERAQRGGPRDRRRYEDEDGGEDEDEAPTRRERVGVDDQDPRVREHPVPERTGFERPESGAAAPRRPASEPPTTEPPRREPGTGPSGPSPAPA